MIKRIRVYKGQKNEEKKKIISKLGENFLAKTHLYRNFISKNFDLSAHFKSHSLLLGVFFGRKAGVSVNGFARDTIEHTTLSLL